MVKKVLLVLLVFALLAGGGLLYLILRHNRLLLGDEADTPSVAAAVPGNTAKWVKVSTNATSTIYLDSTTSERVGNHIMVWLLRDYNEPQYNGSVNYLSSKDQIEVDCGMKRVRRIYSSNHPQSMGEGTFVSSEHGPMSWNDVPGDSIIRRAVDIACKNS